MTLKVTIACPKEPVIAQYCTEKFGERFAARVAKDGDTALVRHDLARILEEEAHKQRWYDFYLLPTKGGLVPFERKTITDAQGCPRYLVPEAVISDEH